MNTPKIIIYGNSTVVHDIALEGLSFNGALTVEVRDDDLSSETCDPPENVEHINGQDFYVQRYQLEVNTCTSSKDLFLQNPAISWNDLIKQCAPMADHILWTSLPKHIQQQVLTSSADTVRNLVCNSQQVIKNIASRWSQQTSRFLWAGLEDVKVTYKEQEYIIADVAYKIEDGKQGFSVSMPQLQLSPVDGAVWTDKISVCAGDPDLTFDPPLNTDRDEQNKPENIHGRTFAEYLRLQESAEVQASLPPEQSSAALVEKPTEELSLDEKMIAARKKIKKEAKK